MRKCLVALTLLFSCINTSFALLNGSGTEASPWLIQSLADFDQFTANSTYWSGHTRLDTDLDLTSKTYTKAPIAPYNSTHFTGTFNGNSHAISNLTILNGASYLGLFGIIDNGSVTDLSLENVDISGTSSVGGLCGYNYYGNITNCYSTGTVTGSDYIGGLCGQNDYGNITNCYSIDAVTGDSSSIGGLCGSNNSGSITGCYATGIVNGIGSDVGGLCGANDGGITSCYSTGTVTGTVDSVGGLCGSNFGSITDCYSTGTVNGGDSSGFLGGLVGYNSFVESTIDQGNIENCYATGSVTGGDSSYLIGGLVGDNVNGFIYRSYATGNVIGKSDVGGLCGWNYDGSVTDCYSTGTVNGEDYVGGLCGWNFGNITSCYSTGSVDGSYHVGGLCGYNENGSIGDSFWDTDTSGQTTSSGGEGKTTAQIQDIDTFLTANWDFVGVWWINQGRDYPKFRFQPFGDLNNDCHVNMYDFAILAAAWLTGPGDVDYNSVAELTGDDIIDTADLAALARQWLMGRQLPEPGDFNKNYRVDLVDFAIFSQAWLTSSGQPGYNEDCDLVDDNAINLADLTIFAENFLQGL